MKLKWIFLAIFLCLIFIVYSYFKFLTRGNFKFYNYLSPGYVMVASASSDGRYAITTHENAVAILWDIKNRTKTYISHNANIYSAYFIKNSDKFIWQDLDNIVHIVNTKGKEIFKFKNFTTYGEVMTSDLKHYFASDINWTIYSGYGNNQKILKNDYDNEYFLYIKKLFNLTLSSNNKYLLTSGIGSNEDYDNMPISAGVDAHAAGLIDSEQGNFSLLEGVTTWNVDNDQPIKKYCGNISRVVATFSPDSQYIVSGDENERVYIWNNKTGKLIKKIIAESFGKFYPYKEKNGYISYKPDFTGYPPIPKSIAENIDNPQYVYNIKFIDADYYLQFNTEVPYAILYSIKKPKPLRYLYMKEKPLPSVGFVGYDYSRDESIDTIPNLHLLVTGQGNRDGIITYKYDPKTLSLYRTWVGNT